MNEMSNALAHVCYGVNHQLHCCHLTFLSHPLPFLLQKLAKCNLSKTYAGENFKLRCRPPPPSSQQRFSANQSWDLISLSFYVHFTLLDERKTLLAWPSQSLKELPIIRLESLISRALISAQCTAIELHCHGIDWKPSTLLRARWKHQKIKEIVLQNCDSYEARLKSLGRSVSGEDEVSNLDSVSEQARLKNQQVIQ